MNIDMTAEPVRGFGTGSTLVASIILGALAFISFNVLRDMAPRRIDTAAGARFTCSVLSVYDGDGPISCAEIDQDDQPVQVRLRGIEARETDDTCHHPHLCPDASGLAAKAELTRIAVGQIRCLSFGPTSYGRIGAACSTKSGVDLSCAMVKSGTAVRWPEYDPEGRLLACGPRTRRSYGRNNG
jgi:endonuclease YncB( thermonuclease family)